MIGTRAAAFAPVPQLGLVAIWDDGDDLHAEPRAPYPHAREVLLTRAQLAEAGGAGRRVRPHAPRRSCWWRPAGPRSSSRDRARCGRAPRRCTDRRRPERARDPAAATARLPSLAWRAARDALAAGAPVLVQVPRRGYLPSVSCVGLPHPGPVRALRRPAGAARRRTRSPACRWCGRPAAAYACPQCGGRRLRAAVVGARRTAEELGRAFPGVPVRTSGARRRARPTVPARAGAGGGHPGRRAGRRRRLRRGAAARHLGPADPGRPAGRRGDAAALAGRGGAGPPAAAGGRVVVVADGALAAGAGAAALGSGQFAARELAERRELGFPPAARMASLTGPAGRGGRPARPGRSCPTGRGAGPGTGRPDWQERALVRVLVRVPPARPARALASALHAGRGRAQRPQGRRPGAGPDRPPRACGGGSSSRTGGSTDSEGTRDRRVTVQPIRLFGDPVLRTPADPVVDFDKELRKLVKDLTETLLDAGRRRPGRAADRRRAAGVRLRRRRRAWATWSTRSWTSPTRRSRTARRAACPSPASTSTPSAGRTWSPRGFNEHGDPVQLVGTGLMARCCQHETDHLDGVLFLDRLDAEPPARRRCRQIREADVVQRRRPAGGEGQPARRGARAGERPMRLVFAGTPEVALPAARRDRRLRARAGRRADPPRRAGRPGPAAGPLAGRRVGRRARASRCSPRQRPREPEFLDRLAELAPGLRAGRRVRRAGAAGRAGDPPARLDQPALLAAARLAWRGAGPARGAARRRGDRGHRCSSSRRAWTPGRSSAR